MSLCWSARHVRDAPPSMAETRRVVYFKTNDQLKDMIKRLDTDGLTLKGVAKSTSSTASGRRSRSATGQIRCTASSARSSTTLRPRSKSEPAHGPVLICRSRYGVGRVEALAPFAVAGLYNAWPLSKASSAVHKCWMVTRRQAGWTRSSRSSSTMRSFGDGTSTAHRSTGSRRWKPGTLRAPRSGRRNAYVDFLDDGPLPKGTKVVMGLLGDAVVGDAVQHGVVDTAVVIADVGGRPCSLGSMVCRRTPPGDSQDPAVYWWHVACALAEQAQG